MFTEEIESGAKLLDRKLGSVWLERQDLTRLDLGDTSNCVVGQAFPGRLYENVLMELLEINDEESALDKAHEYGFCILTACVHKDYDELTEEWKAYIQERRKSSV